MTTTNRWGMTSLPVERSAEAVNTELMQNNAVGLMAVKTSDGYLASYDHIMKFKLDYTDFKSRLIASGLLGKIVKIDLSDREPVVIMTNGVASAESLALVTSKLNYIQFYIDVDVIDKATGAVVGNVAPTVDIKFTIAKSTSGSTTKSYDVTGTAAVVNNTTTKCDYTGYTSDATYGVNIDSIMVTLPSTATVANYTIVLHSLMCSYKEVA